MKKLITSLIAVAMVATSVFAIDLSVGGNLDYTRAWKTVKTQASTTRDSLNYIGINAFFDAQYVRVMFGPSFSVGKIATNLNGTKSSFDGGKFINLNLAILGKYPFEVGIAKIFPMAGFDFSFNVSHKYKDLDLREGYSDNNKKDANHYFFVGGLGADITVVGNFFISPTALFGVDLKKTTGYETAKTAADLLNAKYSNNTFMFNIGLGFGYKL